MAKYEGGGEWGIFTCEGCLERQLYGESKIEEALDRYIKEDEVNAYPMCDCGEEGCECSILACECGDE